MRYIIHTVNILLMLTSHVFCQNLDILTRYTAGKHHGMGGAGLALVEGVAAIDLNPAGMADIRKPAFSLSFMEHLYAYMLINERKEEGLTRIFKWKNLKENPRSLLLALPWRERGGLALGYLNRMSPYLYNQKRAVTWSPLYNQETKGNLHSIIAAFSYKLSSELSVGLAGYSYFGVMGSEVHGENHDRDLDKWAKLENRLRGVGLRAGLQYQIKRLHLGVTFEPSSTIKASAIKSISQDSLYIDLLPDKDESQLVLPLVFGLGSAYRFDQKHLIAMDFEARIMQSSSIQLNLFEYGANPDWKHVYRFRIGGERLEFLGHLPLRIGYSYLPQLYSSLVSYEKPGEIASHIRKNKNIKHELSLGTSTHYLSGQADISVMYSWMNWHHDLFTHVTIQETYIERTFTISLAWHYSLPSD